MASDSPVEVVVAAFRSEDGASNALKDLEGLGKDVVQINESAVLIRDANNELQIKESHHVGKGLIVGGLAGAVVSLVAGPIGWMTAGGAAAGALVQKLRDSGFSDEKLREVGEALTPGTSALIAVVEYRFMDGVVKYLEKSGVHFAAEQVQAEVARQLEGEQSGRIYEEIRTGTQTQTETQQETGTQPHTEPAQPEPAAPQAP
jgi:uncharacterized membrane protein